MPKDEISSNWRSFFISPILLVLFGVLFPLAVFFAATGMVEASGHAEIMLVYLVPLIPIIVLLSLLLYFGLVTYGAVMRRVPLASPIEEYDEAALEDFAALLMKGLGDARKIKLGRIERLLYNDEVHLKLGDGPSERLRIWRVRTGGVNILLTRAARGRATDVDRVMGSVASPRRSEGRRGPGSTKGAAP